MKQEELEFAKEQLKDEEAEAQLAALLKKYAHVRDDFERYEAAGKDQGAFDNCIYLKCASWQTVIIGWSTTHSVGISERH